MINKILLLQLIAIVLLGSCQSNTSVESEDAAASAVQLKLSAEEMKVYGITLGQLEKRILRREITVNGLLDVPPQNLITISAPLGGFVKSTLLLQGMKVKKGDFLVEIQHQDYIRLQQEYLESLSQLAFLESEYTRQEQLAKENVNALKTMEQASAHLQSMKAKVSGLRAQLELAHLSPEKIKAGIIQPSIKLTSPINGFVTEVNINVGKFVHPADPLVKLVDLDHIHAELQVFENEIAQLRTGQQLTFTTINDTLRRQAVVYLIGKEISPERTIRVHCHLQVEDPSLIPGMYITARIQIGSVEREVVPESAVVQFEGEHYVFVGGPGGVFDMVPVEADAPGDGHRPVTFKSRPTQPIVMTGAYSLLSALKNIE